MKLFNTLGGRVETFELTGDVALYVCGVTPYDTTHLGHARTYLVFDALVRHLSASGQRVDYVQNVTDVDDSILQRAFDQGVSYTELRDRYTEIYFEDVAQLGMIPAGVYPRATSAIPEMLDVIGRLLERGIAYEVDGDVFYRVAQAPAYGSLSRLTRAEMLEREAQQDAPTIDDPRKEDPLDFVLWQGARPGEPTWESPWGPGRPGWHIECSTLALKHLGPQIDIHGGGDDLVFPHHEAEIAQSESATGVGPFARCWMHVAMARLDGRKMSKSEGNMVFVRDLLKSHSPDAIRLFCLGTHYRTPLEFDPSELDECAGRAALLAGVAAQGVDEAGSTALADEITERVLRALDDDLDTPSAIAALTELAERLDGPGAKVTYNDRRALRSLAARIGLRLTPAG